MSAVTVKGQVTIPKSIRDLLDIRPGSLVEFVMDVDGRVVPRKSDGDRRQPNRCLDLRGTAGPGRTTDEIMALTRGDE